MKRNKWSVAQQIGVSLVIVTVVVGVFVTLAVRSTRDFMAAARLTSHSQEVLSLLEGILSEMKDAEAGYNAYLISAEPSYLEPISRAQANEAGKLAALRELLSDSPEQALRHETLRTAIAQRLEGLRQGIEQRRTGGPEVARAVLQDGRGKAQWEAVRASGMDMRQDEERLLRQRSEQFTANANSLGWVFQGGGVVAFLIFLTIAVVVGRSLIVTIGEAVAQVQGSSTDLQTSATQQAQGAREQASATTEISTTVKELLATSRQIASSAQQVARVADSTAGAARTGNETVQSAQQSIDAVSRQVEAIVNHMLELGKRSQEIGGILDIINELAEQTNILAINATIESAGAGENGKRFAVVAEEIRKLADRVGGATKDIRVLIDEIRAASNTTIMATEDGSKAVLSSAKQFDDVAGSFRRITELVRANLDVAREIELSTQQQTTAVEQVNTAILEVAQTARQTEASSTQTLETATRLIALSKQLKALIETRARAA